MNRIVVGVCVSLGVASTSARAWGADVELDHFAPNAIKMDGKIGGKEWPGSTPAAVSIKAGKVKATINAGYDDDGVWIGATVEKDGGVVRTSAFGPNEDCVSLVLAFPKSVIGAPTPAYDAYEVGLYAGVPGSSAGAVKMRSSGDTIAGGKIIEAPRKGGGYTLEAFVPWSAFSEGKRVRAGLRGSVRVYDGDGTSIKGIKATSAGDVGDPTSLGWFYIEPEVSLPSAFASRKLTWKDALYDVSADFVGDGANERALVVSRQLYFLGPTYKSGKQWLNMDFGQDVVAIDAKDVTGDGKVDLIATLRTKGTSSTRDAVYVYQFVGTKGAETPKAVFAHETTIVDGSKMLKDLVSFGSKGIDVTYVAAKGWSASDYDQPTSSDIDPILLPWGTVKSRSFVFKSGMFVKDKEVAQKGIAVAAPITTGATTTTTVAAPPPLPKGDPAIGALAQYKKDKGLSSSAAPRMEAVIAIGGGKKGRAALFGKDLVVTSSDGTYAFATMTRFSADKDILEVKAIDVTGDGRDDVVVRGIVHAKMTGGPDGDQDVQREIVTVYAPKTSGGGVSIIPVFAAEVARAMGKNRVEATFDGGNGKITLSKGTATGWTSTTWPFSKETPTSGLEPLVTPWSKPPSVTYAWDGAKFK
jgi:hypothetical protein